MRDLSLSKAERMLARHFKARYKLSWPFAAHLAKDAVCILELVRLKVELSIVEIEN